MNFFKSFIIYFALFRTAVAHGTSSNYFCGFTVRGRSAGAGTTRLVLLNQIIAGPAKDILNLVYGYASMGYKKLPLATLACGDAGWKY
jgi:hypothetical protein